MTQLPSPQRALGRMLLLFLGLLSAVPLRAQPLSTPSALPIPAVRVDANNDYIPDRLGDTLRVAGRASIGTGTFHDERLMVFLQSRPDSTGLMLFAPRFDTPIERGDSVQATGVIQQYTGTTQLRVFDYQVVDEAQRPPQPIEVPLDEACSEAHQGALAQVQGRVIAKNANDGGRYLLINDPDGGQDVLSVFISNDRLSRFDLSAYEVGDYIAVTGVLSQYDYKPPYDSYYQIRPRSGADIEAIGLTARTSRRAVFAGILLLVLAVGAALLFRYQIQRRTQQLAKSRARFRRLAEATSEGIILHEDGRILDINQAITELTGYTREDLLGQNALRFVGPSSRDKARKKIERQEEATYKATLTRKDGSTFPAEVEARNVTFEDQRVRVAAVRDITERKRREAELVAAKEQAEEVARLKTSLLNNMSHELRTPMTSIIGYAELIMSEPADTHDEFATRIRRSGLRLTSTLNAVLEMAQIEAGTLEPHIKTIDAGEVAREVVELFRSSAADRPVEIHVKQTSSTTTLRTDRTLLHRILSNLVSNALKFTDEGAITVTIAPADDGLRLSVQDTGIGIDPDFFPHLFDAFKQESQGFGRSYEGTGLGLAITKHMVDLLGGTIEVESEKGEGSVFTVTLPHVEPSEESAVAERFATEAASNSV